MSGGLANLRKESRMSRCRIILPLVLAAVLSAGATGSEQENQAQEPPELIAGPGVVVTTKPYKGTDSKVYPIPIITYTNGRFFIRGAMAGYRLLADDSWALDATGQWRFDGYEPDDSDDLDGMHERHMTVDAGAALSLFGDWGTAKLSFLNDILSQHDGQELRLTYSKTFEGDKISTTPFVGLSWLSGDLIDYYYGVRSDEAQAGRAAYNAGDGVNWLAGVATNYQLDEQWSLFGSISYEWLNSEITDSPIVDDDYKISILAGAMYKF